MIIWVTSILLHLCVWYHVNAYVQLKAAYVNIICTKRTSSIHMTQLDTILLTAWSCTIKDTASIHPLPSQSRNTNWVYLMTSMSIEDISAQDVWKHGCMQDLYIVVVQATRLWILIMDSNGSHVVSFALSIGNASCVLAPTTCWYRSNSCYHSFFLSIIS